MKTAIVIMLIVFNLSIQGRGQQSNRIERARQLLSNKTWLMQTCVNGQYAAVDSHYYYVYEVDYEGYNFSMSYTEFYYMEDFLYNDRIILRVNKCMPLICFVDSTKRQGNKFEILVSSNEDGDKKKGTLFFVSDKEFVIYPFYGKRERFSLLCDGNITAEHGPVIRHFPAPLQKSSR